MGDFSLSNSRRSQAVLRIAGGHGFKGIIERDIEQSAPEQAALLVLYCGGFRSALPTTKP